MLHNILDPLLVFFLFLPTIVLLETGKPTPLYENPVMQTITRIDENNPAVSCTTERGMSPALHSTKDFDSVQPGMFAWVHF